MMKCHLVYAVKAADVKTVITDGRIVIENIQLIMLKPTESWKQPKKQEAVFFLDRLAADAK